MEEDKNVMMVKAPKFHDKRAFSRARKKSNQRLWSRLAASANNRSAVPLICQLVGETDVIEGNAMVERTNGPLHIFFISRDSRWPS